MTALLCLAIALLLVGIVVVLVPTPSGKPNITIRNDGSLVTVRSAGQPDITIMFDPGDMRSGEPPVELRSGDEPLAEDEVTVLDELADPETPEERKKEIVRMLKSLGYRQASGDRSISRPPETAAQGQTPPQPLDLSPDDGGGCDEGFLYPPGAEEEL